MELKTEPSTSPEHALNRTQTHTSNYIGVSTKGKLGYTLIEDNFCWDLLMGMLVQRATTGGGGYKESAQELWNIWYTVKQTVMFQEILYSSIALSFLGSTGV